MVGRPNVFFYFLAPALQQAVDDSIARFQQEGRVTTGCRAIILFDAERAKASVATVLQDGMTKVEVVYYHSAEF